VNVKCAVLPTLLLAALSSAASAATVSLAPATQSVAPGDPVVLTLGFDFTGDPTLGGGVDVFYDPTVLDFVSFVFGTRAGLDPGYNRAPDDKAGPGGVALGELDGLGFGNFAGLTGPGTVGQLNFLAIGPGTAEVTLAENDSFAGGFYSASTFGPQAVTFVGAEVEVQAVPLPAAAWLLASALGLTGLASARRRRSDP
jgi:hypothetical protein